MCGIFGIIKQEKTIYQNDFKIQKLIINGLNLLKNRGYDSCGIYLYNNNNEFLEKLGVDGEIIINSLSGDIFDLMEDKIDEIKHKNYTKGIGHTRWATHGGKTDFNSHPHISNDGTIKLVHNGIISNFDILKKTYLSSYIFKSSTDTEVIVNMIQYLKSINPLVDMEQILFQLTGILEGTWACIISDDSEPDKLFFIKNENPLLIGTNEEFTMFTSEPSGFMNMVSKYILLRDKTYGYVSHNNIKINGNYKELELIKSSDEDIKLSEHYNHWMIKEIHDQCELSVLFDPITETLRYNQDDVLFDLDFIKPCKYLYIIGCGSSYYAGLIASNYFRFTKAFEFVNVFDGGEFTRAHLDAIENPEQNLLILLLSQSGETRDLNIATTICREFSSNRKGILEPNKLLHKNESNIELVKSFESDNETTGEIKIIGIINVIGSLISRRTIDNIYTNCGRENAVASTKSCTSQIMACLLLSIYKSKLSDKLDFNLKNKFLNNLNNLSIDIQDIISIEDKIKQVALNILAKGKSSIFLLGKDELQGVALEGALKIKEIAYIHAEGYNISALKHGPYALIETDTPIILLYKNRDHFVKSIVEEIKTRGAYVIEISPDADPTCPNSIIMPSNKTFTGLLGVIILQLLSYHLSIAQGINPDRPRNLAKVVTVD